MKVQLKIFSGGSIACTDSYCSLRSECANHETAGDNRKEYGVTPTWKDLKFFLGGGEVDCHFESGSQNGAWFISRLAMLKEGAAEVRTYVDCDV